MVYKAPVTGLYLPDGALTTWRNAKAAAAAGTGVARVLHWGDSIPAGTSGASGFATTYGELLASYWQAQFGHYGDYWAAYLAPGQGGASGATNPWSALLNSLTTASVNGDLTAAFHPTQKSQTNFAVEALRFTSPYAVTEIDLHYVDDYPGTWNFIVDPGTSGHTFNYQVTGGSLVSGASTNTQYTITNSSPAFASANFQAKKLVITGLTSGVHAVGVGWASAAGSMNILGARTLTGASSGLDYIRVLCSGWALWEQSYVSNFQALWSNKVPQTDTTTIGSGAYDTMMLPHLMLQELFVNDISHGLGAGTIASATGNVLSALRRAAGSNNPSQLWLQPYYPDLYSDNAGGGYQNNNAYQNLFYNMADATFWGYALAIMNARWGSTPFGQGFMSNNNIHPTDAGHADIATFLKACL